MCKARHMRVNEEFQTPTAIGLMHGLTGPLQLQSIKHPPLISRLWALCDLTISGIADQISLAS